MYIVLDGSLEQHFMKTKFKDKIHQASIQWTSISFQIVDSKFS
jgi:hypothetical protein